MVRLGHLLAEHRRLGAVIRRLAVLSLALVGAVQAQAPTADFGPVTRSFLELLVADGADRQSALQRLSDNWEPSYTPMVLEMTRLDPAPEASGQLLRLLREHTGQDFGYDVDSWWRWVWQREPDLHEEYSGFKSALYGLVDPAFRQYFSAERAATARVRLDEVRWGGVGQDGIPPLRNPSMVAADRAGYLDDGDVTFGIEIDGEARAYPRRILAHHEMFTDVIGGEPVAGVYCTLCGTMILYRTRIDGVDYHIGTSGFLYRSNKLMYDRATQSLWSTLWGEPVLGPLVGQGLRLERLSVVTTTWGEWRRRHPDTTVLSIDTGHRRDYGEGAAYRSYFATDELMFGVPVLDRRLRNKDEVFGLLLAQHPGIPVALAARYLVQHPVHHERIGSVDLVILTDASGAHRAYETGDVHIAEWDRDATAVDENGTTWTLSESRLSSPDGRTLARLPAHRAFWFGWYSAFSHTRLVM